MKFLGNHYNLSYVSDEDEDDSHSELFLLLNFEQKECCVIGVFTVKTLFSALLRQRNANKAIVTKTFLLTWVVCNLRNVANLIRSCYHLMIIR